MATDRPSRLQRKKPAFPSLQPSKAIFDGSPDGPAASKVTDTVTSIVYGSKIYPASLKARAAREEVGFVPSPSVADAQVGADIRQTHTRLPHKLPLYAVLYPTGSAGKHSSYQEAVNALLGGMPMLVGMRKEGSKGKPNYVTIGDLPSGHLVVLAYSNDQQQKYYKVP